MGGKHRVHRRRTDIATILVCLLLIGLTAAAYFSATRQLHRLNAQAEEMRQEIRATTEENAALEYQIEHRDDPEVMEQVIREQFGYVKPGDKVFYDTGH